MFYLMTRHILCEAYSAEFPTRPNQDKADNQFH